MPSGGDFRFGPYRLDPRSQRLLRHDVAVSIQPLQFHLLQFFVEHPEELLTKDQLIESVWNGTFVSDASLTKAMHHLRYILDPDQPSLYIQTAARVGYRFVAPVSRVSARHSDEDLVALMAPHRALVDGRAALETLEAAAIRRARHTFEDLVARDPDEAMFHVGLANACAMQFEATRTDAAPDMAALHLAVRHAREACRLNANYGEAWATLGFVLERAGQRVDAVAAARRSVTLEPDNWRHHLRLSAATWGEERLRAARHTLAECPHLPMAHFLAATVFVARDALTLAEREIDEGVAALTAEASQPARFSGVAVHWFKGLLSLARGEEAEALAAFDRELALEPRGHLYARECAANTWYAKGACALRRGDRNLAKDAFDQAIARVPAHSMARAGLAILDGRTPEPLISPTTMDAAIAYAALLAHHGDARRAAEVVAAALAAAPAGNAGWVVPIEPLLGVQHPREAWTPVLAALHVRAR